jgi:serine/threonine-protein kinase
MAASLQLEALDMFAAWLDWPHAVRNAQLGAELADRPDLLAEVRRLIRADADAAMLPTQPPEPIDLNADVTPPERVGVYRLTEQIGRGGMGMVFRAERDDGVFAQTVAIKLIRRSLFAASAAAQFASERQILARLRHPHIAQLFDGGVGADGESYIVMELIVGDAITTHCTAHGLPLKARVALMETVCDAVQFAHQQLIVHADIKPSNVVVDAHYGVKLLDFGIARIIDATADTGTSATHGQTPAFASPQQAAGAAPTPSDDIYALGKLLGALTGAEAVPGELAAVIARATAPDPTERYATAAELGADLRRWHDGRPVRALPAGRGRTTRMFVRRHWLGVGLTALAVIALIGATAITSLLYVRAETARRQSERRFEETRHLSRYLLSDVTDTLQHFPGTSKLRHDIALRGRSYLETLSHVPGAPLDMRLEVAQGYTKTATILGQPGLQSLGDPRLAKRDLAVAETSLRRLMAETHDRTDVALALSDALSVHAAITHVLDNDTTHAGQFYRQACALAREVITREPRNDAARMAEIRCLVGIANIHDYEGQFAAMKAPLTAIAAELRHIPPQPDDAAQAMLVGNFDNLSGDYLYYTDRREASLQMYAREVDVLERARSHDPDVRLLERVAWADYNYSGTLDILKRDREALAVVDKGVAAADLMLYFEKSPRAHHIDNALHSQRSVILSALKRFPEAIAEGEAALAAFRVAAAASPDNFEAARAVPVNMRPVAEIYWDAGRHAEACTLLAQTRDTWTALARTHRMTGFDAGDERGQVARLLARCPG